jgi:hypothetical protein
MQADPVSFNGRVQGPMTFGETEATLMAAARVGVWSVYRDPSLENLIERWSTLDPLLTSAWRSDGSSDQVRALTSNSTSPTTQFYDFHGAVRLELSPYRYLYVSGYHGSSSLGADLVLSSPAQAGASADGAFDPTAEGAPLNTGREVPTYDRYEWSNTVAQARYEWLMGARATGSVRGYLSRYASTSTYEIGRRDLSPLGTGPDRADVPNGSNQVNELGLEGRLDLSLSSSTRIDLSVGAQLLSSQFRVNNAFIPTLTHEVRTTRWTAAGKIESTVGLNVTLEAGSRLTYVPSRKTLYAEPRGAVRYDRSLAGLGDVAVRVAGGLYRQYTNQFDLSRDGATAVVPTASVWFPVDHSLAPQRAVHLATDLLWMPADPWRVNLEGYMKWQPHLLAVDYPTLQEYSELGPPPSDRPLSQSTFIAPSRGRAYGGGIRVGYDTERLKASLAYAYSTAKRTVPHRFDGRLLPTPWNEPHRLTLRTTVPLVGGLSALAQAHGVWGRSWGFRQAYYDYLAPTSDLSREELTGGDFGPLTPYDLDDPSDHVLPPLYRIDAGLSYAKTWNGIDLQAQVSLINVLDRANVVEWRLQPQGGGTFDRFARVLPGRRPVFSVRVGY